MACPDTMVECLISVGCSGNEKKGEEKNYAGSLNSRPSDDGYEEEDEEFAVPDPRGPDSGKEHDYLHRRLPHFLVRARANTTFSEDNCWYDTVGGPMPRV